MTTTRILTVDDSPSMRALLNHALSAQGFAVSQAEDGMAALDWLAHNEVDVVITDINMPRLDGFGLIERLRDGTRHRDRPILVLTTESSEDKKARARLRHGQQSLRAVAAHAGQQDADGMGARDLRDRLEQHIDRRHMARNTLPGTQPAGPCVAAR